MSSSTAAVPHTALPISGTDAATTSTNYLSNLGLGYAIAIALGILVLFSTIVLASYFCCRASHRHARNNDNNMDPTDNTSSITLPRIIFVAEDDHEINQDDQNVVVGLDHAVINSYPKFTYTKKSSVHVRDDDDDCDERSNNKTCCSICLCEYKECEMLRMMPECQHYFHLVCLDAWLKLNGSCPVCRNSPLPTPLSTPLSEVVPLSQYGDGRRTRR